LERRSLSVGGFAEQAAQASVVVHDGEDVVDRQRGRGEFHRRHQGGLSAFVLCGSVVEPGQDVTSCRFTSDSGSQASRSPLVEELLVLL